MDRPAWLTRDAVLAAVEAVPAGSVATYGDIARRVGTGPRQVGRILAASDAEGVPWWRIVNAAGRLPEDLTARASERWDAEGIAHRDGRVDVRAHRVR